MFMLRMLSIVLFCLMASAQGTITIRQLREFLKSSMQMKQADKDVAGSVRGLKLSERLDDRTIEELQGQGLGPKTVAALRSLRDASVSLRAPGPDAPPPPPPQLPPPPSAEERADIIAAARENALNYSNGLPNYICLQVTRRYYSRDGRGETGSDTIAERLTYYNHKEEYKMVTHNDQVTNVNAEKLGGSLSRGEFGSLLREIFDPSSQTQFNWERWSGLNQRWSYVFAFRVPLATSQYTIHSGHDKDEQVITVGFSGSIFIDKGTNRVMRVRMHADDIPATFPVQAASQQLDYAFQKIGDQEFLLPLISEMKMKMEGRLNSRNVIEFRNYNKYSADTVIKFDTAPPDTPPPLDDARTKEQPPK